MKRMALPVRILAMALVGTITFAWADGQELAQGASDQHSR